MGAVGHSEEFVLHILGHWGPWGPLTMLSLLRDVFLAAQLWPSSHGKMWAMWDQQM